MGKSTFKKTILFPITIATFADGVMGLFGIELFVHNVLSRISPDIFTLEAVSSLMVSLSLAIAVGLGFPYIFDLMRREIKSHNEKNTPDTSIREALEYIITNSILRGSLPNNDHGLNDAAEALKACILSGKIYLFGTSDANPMPTKIALSELNSERLPIICTSNIETIAYVTQDGSDDEMYRNLMIPSVQLKKSFQHKQAIHRKYVA